MASIPSRLTRGASRLGSGVATVWRRVPRLVRGAGVAIVIYKGYAFFTRMDTLYKLTSPSRHALGSTVLDLDLTSLELVSHDGRRSRSPLEAGAQASVPRIAAALRAARDDPRIAGLVVRGVAGLRGAGLADVAELRRAVEGFGEGVGGKPAVLHVPEGMGLDGNGTVPLYFASAFRSSHVMPTAAMMVPGLSFASLFFKRTLDLVGVSPIKVARKEYKTAANSFTEEGYTEPHRESTQALMDGVLSVLTGGIAKGRGMKGSDVSSAFDEAVMTAQDAVDRGLVDACAYRDELPGIMRRHLASGVRTRYEARVAADGEWREAMAGLVDAWKDGDPWEHQLAQVDTLLKAMHFAARFARKKEGEGEGEGGGVARAELRALKSHLAWLETQPWEGAPREQASEQFPAGHAFSLIELERRLCVEAIRAHEEFDDCLEELMDAARKKESGSVSVSDEKLRNSVRFTRALWRAKALCARMVGSLSQSPDPEEKVESDGVVASSAAEKPAGGASDGTDSLMAAAAASGPAAPRLFLLHQSGTPALQNAAPIEGAVDSVDEVSKSKPQYVDKLRYVALTDYQSLVSSENQAGATARNSWSRAIASRPELISIPSQRGRLQFTGGVVDAAEHRQLSHLADHQQLLGAWRLNSTRTQPTIAVVHVDGAIMDAGSENLRGAIRRAGKDPRIDAIVVRVDSPGGSASASDLISRAVEVTKTKKPIVCSMGNVCASGGLYIAVPAHKVFAEEATITGSCGVIFSGFLPIELFGKLGVTVDSVDSNRFSKYFGSAASVTEWDAAYRERIDSLIDDMYKSFVTAVSRGRGMAYDEVEAVARGRVWSGIDAKRVGLVDEFGGLNEAAACAAELAGGEPGVPPALVSYPSMAMRLEDNLKANGIIRSRLDEEGDEESPRERRGRKPRGLSRLLSGDDDEDEESPEDGSETDGGERGAGGGEKKDGDDGGGDDDPTSITDLVMKPEKKNGPSSSLTRLGARLGGLKPQALLISAAEPWLDFRDSCVSSCALWCLDRLENNLMGENPSTVASMMADYLLGSVLGHSGVSAAVDAEIQAAAATSGRPAMIMSPQIHSGIGAGPTSRSGR